MLIFVVCGCATNDDDDDDNDDASPVDDDDNDTVTDDDTDPPPTGTYPPFPPLPLPAAHDLHPYLLSVSRSPSDSNGTAPPPPANPSGLTPPLSAACCWGIRWCERRVIDRRGR